MIGVVVKTMNNGVYNFSVPFNMNVHELKSMVKESTSISEDRQRLIYRGRVLDDSNSLDDYKIEDGQTIHMVAKPADYEELQSRIASQETSLGTNLSEESLEMHSVRNSLQSLLALSSLAGGGLPAQLATRRPPVAVHPEPGSMEMIRQGLLTMHTLLSTQEGGSSVGRRFFVSQWVDVKDTVNQWLEATVMEVDDEQERIFVHYNGWPTRWDEWLPASSPRVAPFRTRTTNVTIHSSSPAPTNTVAHAPPTGADDLRFLLPEVCRAVNMLQPALQEASRLCRESTAGRSVETPLGSGEEEFARGMPWGEGEETTSRSQWQRAGRSSHRGDQGPGCEERLRGAVGDLCPLLDRLGRALTDTAAHMYRVSGSHNSETRGEEESPQEQLQEETNSTMLLGTTQGLRRRSPSPPPESHYRLPVSQPTRAAPGSLLGAGNHIDIHIHAILTPLRAGAGQQDGSSATERIGDSTSTTVDRAESTPVEMAHPDSHPAEAFEEENRHNMVEMSDADEHDSVARTSPLTVSSGTGREPRLPAPPRYSPPDVEVCAPNPTPSDRRTWRPESARPVPAPASSMRGTGAVMSSRGGQAHFRQPNSRGISGGNRRPRGEESRRRSSVNREDFVRRRPPSGHDVVAESNIPREEQPTEHSFIRRVRRWSLSLRQQSNSPQRHGRDLNETQG